jgi:hypothetical protein
LRRIRGQQRHLNGMTVRFRERSRGGDTPDRVDQC